MTYLVLVNLSRSTFDNENLNDEKNENTAEYNNKIQWDFGFAHSLTYLNNRGQGLKQFIVFWKYYALKNGKLVVHQDMILKTKVYLYTVKIWTRFR